jgi:hypothetical protein
MLEFYRILETKKTTVNDSLYELDAVDARWLNFVRHLDARNFNFVRPTPKLYAAVDLAFSLLWSPYTKFWRQGRRDAP